jgi:Pyruvate/2-oxoacid:ferredoxin oxidoreductase delta subunit
MPQAISVLVVLKFFLWLGVVVVATALLRRRRITARVRLVFLLSGTLVFGFLFGLLTPAEGLDPNPVFSVRSLIRSLAGTQAGAPQMTGKTQQLVAPIAGMLLLLLGLVWASNKSLCGWGCPLGLLQDLLNRARLPKWRPSFRLGNSVRFIAFVALVAGIAVAGLDWIGWIDPFQIFRFNLGAAVGVFGGLLLVASLFVYRPWCQFLCPFGLLGWVVEQFSLLRPRIDRQACRNCQLCVKACPTSAMADIYAGSKLHADCFACGACLLACPREGALRWRSSLRKISRRKHEYADSRS